MNANLLRAYNTALSSARTNGQLLEAHHDFHVDRRNAMSMSPAEKWLAARDDIYHAHAQRIIGRGSPAECDAALAKAIKELGT